MKKPKASIGIPVYNGEKFLAQAIESVLNQSFTDFELIISDNASTDKTREISESYADRDPRIRYYRHETNQGATWNFNHAFELAYGEYFNWLPHDDKLAPDFLKRGIQALDENPDDVLCFSKFQIVDESSQPIEEFDVYLRTDSPRPSQRFYDMLMVWHDCLPIFGLIRSSALEKTPLIGAYSLGDAVLLARLSLMGKFYKISEPSYISRRHPLQSNKKYNIWVDHHAYHEWFAPTSGKQLVMPQWEVLFDIYTMIDKYDMPISERIACYQAVARWTVRYRKLLIKDCIIALNSLFSKTRPLLGS
jgi:glycosyltransferase involved in cell wall biosynthesis